MDEYTGTEGPRPYTLKFYRRDRAFRKSEYRWTLKHTNGNIVGASSQGYSRAIDCRDNAAFVTGYEDRMDIRVVNHNPGEDKHWEG